MAVARGPLPTMMRSWGPPRAPASGSAKARATGQPLTDPFENWSGQRPLGPIILIGIGALFLLNNFGFFEFFRVRQIFVPLLLIGIGFFMLKNRVSGKS